MAIHSAGLNTHEAYVHQDVWYVTLMGVQPDSFMI
jgi:hypothetical protein